MDFQNVSRRRFIGGAAATAGILALSPREIEAMWHRGFELQQGVQARSQSTIEAEYDAFAKLASNENPYGPPESVLKAITHAFKYANRYGYPDAGIMMELANHHGVKPENIVLGAGSGEILDVTGLTFLDNDSKVVGSDPSYGSVYQQATNIRSEAYRIPLRADFTQDIPAILKSAKQHYREVGFVYVCNPNNPTGRIIPQREMKQLVDGLPEDMPILIDEAYHHFVNDKDYATSVPLVLEGRPVIIARTFSKIAALAGVRIGYAITTPEIARKMRLHQTGTVSALARHAAVAALKDTESQAKVKQVTTDLRQKAVADLKTLGFDSIPSEGNFFMVSIKKQVQPVIEDFRKRGVLVGRPFPPMLEHLRVSVGTPEEMGRFATAFRQVFATGSTAGQKSGG
jgi:histidinol-phosphate aminotransferase